MSRDFEWTFEIAEQPTAEQLEFAEETFDGIVSIQDGLAHMSIAASGSNAESAAMSAVDLLREQGIHPLGVVWDLVNRSGIAERAGVTRQAVSNWVTGRRNPVQTSFPNALSSTAGGIWVWGEILPWLRDADVDVEFDVDAPTLVELAKVDLALKTPTEVMHLVKGQERRPQLVARQTIQQAQAVETGRFLQTKPREQIVVNSRERFVAHG